MAGRQLLADFYDWPNPGESELLFDEGVAFSREVIDRIETLPKVPDYAGRANDVLVVNNAATGPTQVANADQVRFALKPVHRFRPYVVEMTGANLVLTDNAHLGAEIEFTDTTPRTITIAPTLDPDTGVSSPFACTIHRLYSAAALQLVFSGCTNRRPDGFTRIAQGWTVRIRLRGTDVIADGPMEP